MWENNWFCKTDLCLRLKRGEGKDSHIQSNWIITVINIYFELGKHKYLLLLLGDSVTAVTASVNFYLGFPYLNYLVTYLGLTFYLYLALLFGSWFFKHCNLGRHLPPSIVLATHPLMWIMETLIKLLTQFFISN